MAEATRTRTRLAREERREQIIDAAAELFSHRDPAVITFEEIADAAGVSRALVYNYFGDRNGLVEAVYVRNLRRIRRRVAAVLASTKGRENALHAMVRVHLDCATEDPHGYRYVASPPAFVRLSELEAERVAFDAANLGGHPAAALVARGYRSSLQSMVLHWLDHRDEIDIERAAEVITAFLSGSFRSVYGLGVRLTPQWSVPQ